MFAFSEKFSAVLPKLPSARATLMVSLFLLLSTSLLMIASASIPFAMNNGLHPMRFFWSQLLYVGLGVIGAAVIYRLPMNLFRNFNNILIMYLGLVVLLILTLIFADSINGSKRWLNVAGFSIQAAEIAKMVMVFVAAEYVVRRSAEMRDAIWTGWRLLIWYAPVIFALIFQPDFGSSAVLGATLLVIAFIGGSPVRDYMVIFGLFFSAAVAAILMSDYRRERLFSFVDPFDDIQDTDYQLARSLIAFGRGEFSGVGYGDSVQKLSHLPEAHTDFLIAITGEELGFIGVVFVLVLEALIVLSIMRISLAALKRNQLYLSYTVFGFGTVFFGQVCINIGMNMGILPTKGLTLPFYSFGGSAMLVSLAMIGYILKVDAESVGIERRGNSRSY
ncbi:cell division protein FtsW [Moraxella caviae]|nr:putative peptidoglycan glycosyltransferase FtsW [Moraxella caviae]OOR89273.1 cell division protein FtsW [Moraxella caviae]